MLVFDPNQKCRFILAEQTPVTDYTTKAQVMDKNGKPLHRYTVLVLREEGRPATIRVKAPATPQLEPGMTIVFQSLTGTLWERDGNVSVAFSATGVAPVAGAPGVKQ